MPPVKLSTNINDSIFIQLLKNHTDIDNTFINIFFKKYKIGGELDFDIKDINIAQYLGIKLITLRNRLNNAYSKKQLYFNNVDYVKIKGKNTSSITYMINYSCFERLSMNGDSIKSEKIRLYFTKLRQFIVENQYLIFQAMENKEDLSKYNQFETIYFFAVDATKFKIGHTNNIIQRLRNYNVGRIKEVELKYLSLVKNRKLIESCMKIKLHDKQVFKDKEIYEIDPRKLKKIIDDCYCKYIPKKESEELYKEISDLLGMYTYVKDKINIKPYIIIGKNL